MCVVKNINILGECMYEISFLSNARYVDDGGMRETREQFRANDWRGLDGYYFALWEVQK